MNRITSLMICILFLIGCSSKNSQNADSVQIEQDVQTDTMEKDKQELPDFNYQDIDIKELAQLLVEDKKSGEPNDSTFVDFFLRCGMEYGELPDGSGMKGFCKNYANGSFIIITSECGEFEEGVNHHKIDIHLNSNDTDRLQWMIVQLRAFGMKDVESEAVKLEGEGLSCIGLPGQLTIGY